MSSSTAARTLKPATRDIPLAAPDILVEPLGHGDTAEVLTFLAQRPLHTVALAGFIRDNGLVSTLNRGRFYGCRNRHGQLEGVALIGHATLMETDTDRALAAFAEVAQKCLTTHLIMGEQERIDEFWNYYAEAGQQMRLACRELLFELRWPIEVHPEVSGLRVATLDDLELIVPVHAQLAEAESGLNPFEEDSQGFRQRCVRRIEQGRTWVWVDSGKLIFKAEVVSETPEVIYLEGVWVNPSMRGQRLGQRCMSHLAKDLLSQDQSLCVLVNGTNTPAQHFYKSAGYKLRGTYDTIFLA